MNPPLPTPPRRTSSLGCFGVFCTFCLIIATAVEGGLLLYLNPTWFDKLALWRGERFEAEVFLANDAATRQRLAEQDQVDRPVQSPPQAAPRTIVRFEFATTQITYDPAREAKLEAPEGTTLTIPAGAIAEPCAVSIVPISQLPDDMQAQFAGPIYDVRIGQNEHYNFRQPVRMTMPYLPEETDLKPRIAVYEGSGWRELPTEVDPQAHTVTAEVPHASFLSVVWDVTKELYGITKGTWNQVAGPVFDPVTKAWRWLSPGAQRFLGYPASIDLVSRVILSGTARGWGRSVGWAFCQTHDTENFAIHYTRTGEHACVLNPEYDGSADQPGMAPNYVVRIGQILEDARRDLEAKGWPLPTRLAGFRYDVFLIESGAYGESALNGPILLNRNLTAKAKLDQQNPELILRAVTVHELIHVAQGDFYGIRKAMVEGYLAPMYPLAGAFINKQTWWIELTAAYSADHYWRRQAKVTDMVEKKYLLGLGSLLTTPMNEAGDPQHYAYGSFLKWLDRKREDAGYDLMWKAFKNCGVTTGEATLTGLDELARESFKQGLGELFTQYAQDFYVNDIWEGRLVPGCHRDTWPDSPLEDQFGLKAQLGTTKNFVQVARAAGQNAGVPTYQTNDFALASSELMKQLSAHAAYVMIEALPQERKAKLVLRVTTAAQPPDASFAAKAEDVQFHLAQAPYDFGRTKLPAKGPRPQWSRLAVGERQSTVLELWKKRIHFVAVVGVNKSLTGIAPGFILERWLLKPPAEIKYQREGDAALRHWKVTWKHEDLHLSPPAFANYVVYRKELAEPEAAYVEVARLQDDFFIDTAPTGGVYCYTVATEDKAGNVSEKGRPENDDPFEGVWSGEIALVQGEIVNMLDTQFNKQLAESDKRRQVEFAKVQDPADRARQAAAWEKDKQDYKQVWTKIKEFLGAAEALAKIGMPLQLEIKRAAGNDREYEVRLKEFLYQRMKPQDQPDPVRIVRVGERTAAVKQSPVPGAQPLPPLLLTLVRMKPASKSNVIRQDAYQIPGDPASGFKGCTIRWEFERQEGKSE